MSTLRGVRQLGVACKKTPQPPRQCELQFTLQRSTQQSAQTSRAPTQITCSCRRRGLPNEPPSSNKSIGISGWQSQSAIFLVRWLQSGPCHGLNIQISVIFKPNPKPVPETQKSGLLSQAQRSKYSIRELSQRATRSPQQLLASCACRRTNPSQTAA